ncbi:flagellar hook-associated protein FlgK [Amaricoccus sp.]|uniref:flagellar hook-associated protein FlgK n=1 Tax=Amaricoccus sp. TaxID=1872485 RepID=UPI002624E4AE|nr:flagellar hook-associated protein FlgK [Amaricoccus sp.]HRO10326.1 flagellar hook-associated protein FlgK [Amaricoccus sp.]
MGISSALNNAASGLAASSRLADTISNNVANAMTVGYARRTTELSSLTAGGYGSGVKVTGTYRAENAYLTSERRALDAQTGASGTIADTYERIMAVVGEAGADSSLSTLATALETTLMSATASPQSTTKLTDAVTAAKNLADALNRVSDENSRIRTEADAEIARQVGQVNDTLHAIDDINKKIATLAPKGVDVTSLQDERNRLIDGISAIIPVKVAKRDGDQVALYSQNGGLLLDGQVYELKFTQAPNVVTAEMSLGSPLGGLSQDLHAASGPVAVAAGTGSGLFDGGTLGALFEVRDSIVPEVDAEMDRYANDLIERFRDLMPATWLDASGEGLFVDGSGSGSATGLAGRIEVNAAVDASAGGAAWRLRDGLSAATAGAEGNGVNLQALADAMGAARQPIGFISQSANAGGALMASEISSFLAGRSARSDDSRAYLTARQSALVEQEVGETGVNTDSELASLTLVEQAYAANARVLSVIDDLMRLLLEI